MLSEKDKETIFFIKKILGFGRVEFKPNEIWKRKGMTNVKNQYAYTVSGMKDAEKLVSILNESLFKTSKKEDFLLWKKALEIIKNCQHLTYEGFTQICEIRDSMNLKKKRKNYKGKYQLLDYVTKNKNLFSEKNLEKRKKICLSLRRLNEIKK